MTWGPARQRSRSEHPFLMSRQQRNMQHLRCTDVWMPDLAMAHPRHAVRHDGRGKEQPLLTNNKLIHAPRPSRTLRPVSTDAGPGSDRPFVVVGTGVVRHGRGRNVPSAIAGQLETLGSCAGSGVQVLKGCVSYPAKLSAAPHAQPSRNEKDANSFCHRETDTGRGVKPCQLPTFPSRSRQGRSARHPARLGRTVLPKRRWDTMRRCLCWKGKNLSTVIPLLDNGIHTASTTPFT